MDQRVCVIVGAGEGLGRSLAAAFATKGFAIALLSRSEKGSAAALEAARGANPTAKVRFFAGDATQAPALEAAVARAATEMGGCDVLIYNARGDLRYKPPLQIEYDFEGFYAPIVQFQPTNVIYPGTIELASQVSTPLQYCPSEQTVLFGACWHPVAGVQVSTVQPIPSSQLNGGG